MPVPENRRTCVTAGLGLSSQLTDTGLSVQREKNSLAVFKRASRVRKLLLLRGAVSIGSSLKPCMKLVENLSRENWQEIICQTNTVQCFNASKL